MKKCPLFFSCFLLPLLIHLFIYANNNDNDNDNDNDNVNGFYFAKKQKSVSIPIDIQNNLILIPIKINQSETLQFIVDTGVKTTLLTTTVPQVEQKMTIDKQHRKIKVWGLGEGKPVESIEVSGLTMELPGIIGKNMRLIILPPEVLELSNMFGKPVHGIIGYELFKQFVVEINYRRKFIRLHQPNRYKYRGKGKKLPITIERTKPYIETKIINDKGELFVTKLLIDTGSSSAISIWSKDRSLPEKTLAAYLGYGLSGDIFGKIGRVQQVQLGNFQFDQVIAAYPETTSVNLLKNTALKNGNLGSEILKRFHVIFDYSNQQIFLKKNSAYKEPFTYKKSGLELIIQNKGDFKLFIISYVRPDSPAAQSDVQIGDIITAINNTTTFFSQIGDLYHILNGRNGKKVRLKLMRNGEVFRRKFKLRDEL